MFSNCTSLTTRTARYWAFGCCEIFSIMLQHDIFVILASDYCFLALLDSLRCTNGNRHEPVPNENYTTTHRFLPCNRTYTISVISWPISHLQPLTIASPKPLTNRLPPRNAVTVAGSSTACQDPIALIFGFPLAFLASSRAPHPGLELSILHPHESFQIVSASSSCFSRYVLTVSLCLLFASCKVHSCL